MRSHNKGLLVFFFVFANILLGSENVEKKGIVTYADGTVKRQSTQEEMWLNAPVNTDILAGDRVRTYRESRAEMDLAGLDIIRLAPRTIIDIVRLYEETKDQKIKTEINLESGALWASVHEVELNTGFDVSTPIAAAAITGTVFRFNVEEDSTTQLKVYKGEVKITNAPENTQLQPQSLIPHEVPGPHEVKGPHEISVEEWLYIVRSMQQITLDNKGQVISKGEFGDEDKDEKDEWILWNKKRDAKRLESINKLLNKN